MIDKRDKTPQRARESLTSSFHCQAPHFSSSQHARMHSPALPPPRGRTSPNPKHCPTSSLGFHVASSHALLRASASPSDVITPSFFFSLPRDTRCWPCHRRGAWSEHQAGTPSFSIPSRTSFPWRHPTSRRYCQVMHSESSQQDTAQSGTEDAPGIGLKDSGHFPRRSSSVFHGDAGQDGTSVPPRGGTDNDDDDDSPTEPTSFKEDRRERREEEDDDGQSREGGEERQPPASSCFSSASSVARRPSPEGGRNYPPARTTSRLRRVALVSRER